MTCPTCVTLTRERDNARDLAAALEEELARRDGARSDVRASRAPEVAQHLTEQPPIYAADHGWTPSLPVFTAIEETRRGHGYRNPLTQLCDCGEELASEEKWRFHVTVEVARAAEVAALHALARWALADRESRTHDLQGELLIPLWLIGARASAIEEKK